MIHKLRLILNCSQLLHAQVKLLLDKNLIDSDHFVPQLTKTNFGDLVQKTIEILMGTAGLKGLDIIYHSIIFNDKVLIDPVRTQQIIINLLSNAIKFSKINQSIEVNVNYDLIGKD